MFANSHFSSSSFTDCVFTDCNLSLVQLKNSGLKNVHFINCKLIGIAFHEADDFLFQVQFTDCILDFASFSYKKMPAEAFPEIIMPQIYVGTAYPGNSPLDIEKLITRPLEKEINGISGVDKINSTSVEGYSTIQVKFNF